MKYIYFLLLILCSSEFKAQTLGRLHIGTSHAQGQNGNISLTYSMGEPIIGTHQGSSIILTKGFQQPDPSSSSFPVEWLSLSVVQKEKDALLQWTTAWEENSAHYEVERSLDGRTFDSLALVAAAGNSQSVLHYQFLDPDITKLGVEILYYRLKQLDFDGRHQYSQVLQLPITRSNDLWLSVFPNPTWNQVHISYQIPNGTESSLELADIHGKILKRIPIQQSVGTQIFQVKELARGAYLIRLSGIQGQLSRRLIVR
ncbi:MAG: T9SS type A sorting domain-containing protein [Bacteroidota bacterium]